MTGLAAAALLMITLHVLAIGQMGVLDTTMSDYVFVPEVGWMFGAALTSVAAAGVGVLLGMAGTGLLASRLLRLALGVAGLGALLAAVFPTDLGESLSASAQIHRYAAGVVFYAVPIAGLVVARWLRGRDGLAVHRVRLYGVVTVTAVVLTLFMTSHFGVLPEWLQELNGLFQRLLFALELCLLAQLIAVPMRLSRAPGA